MRFQKRLLSRIPFLICFVVMLGALTSVAFADYVPLDLLDYSDGCAHAWECSFINITPTCAHSGMGLFRCNNCGQKATSALAALDHDWTEITRTLATCTTTGSVSFRCSMCSEVKTEPLPTLGHDWIETSYTPAGCGSPGTIYYDCSRCDETKTETIPQLATDHTWVETGRTEPTSTSEGTITYQCSICGETKSESIPQLEDCIHKWKETDRIEATTTTPGQITYVCQKCGLVETKSIPVKPVYDGTFMNWLGSVVGLFNMTMNEIMGFQATEFFTGVLVFMTMFSLMAKLIQQGRRGRL